MSLINSWRGIVIRCLAPITGGFLALAGSLSAAERLTNVPEPTVVGEEAISADAPEENPTMMNLRAGNIEVHPYAGAGVGYESNIYRTDQNHEDDAFYQVSPGLLIRNTPAKDNTFQFSWNSNLLGMFFVNESKANTVQFSSVAGAAVTGQAWDFELKVGGGRFEDPVDVTFADRTPRAIGEGKAKAVYKGLEKLIFDFGYHGSYIDYHTDRFSSLDRVEHEVPVRALYKIGSTSRVYVNSAWHLTEFRNPGLNNFYYVDSRLGFTGDFLDGKIFTFDINAGVAVFRIKNDNGLNPSVRAVHVVFDSYFQWTPTPQTLLGLAVYGTPRVQLANTQPIRPVYGARLDVGYKMMDNRLQIFLSGFYERTDNLPPDVDQIFLSGSLRVRYRFNHYSFAFVSYQLQARQAEGIVLDYVNNKVMLGGGVTL